MTRRQSPSQCSPLAGVDVVALVLGAVSLDVDRLCRDRRCTGGKLVADADSWLARLRDGRPSSKHHPTGRRPTARDEAPR